MRWHLLSWWWSLHWSARERGIIFGLLQWRWRGSTNNMLRILLILSSWLGDCLLILLRRIRGWHCLIRNFPKSLNIILLNFDSITETTIIIIVIFVGILSLLFISFCFGFWITHFQLLNGIHSLCCWEKLLIILAAIAPACVLAVFSEHAQQLCRACCSTFHLAVTAKEGIHELSRMDSWILYKSVILSMSSEKIFEMSLGVIKIYILIYCSNNYWMSVSSH